MAAPGAAKRLKLSTHLRGEDDYVPGNIVEMEIRNFMTYEQLTCRPGSRLNLVVGPNGSGKSSLVCAIALGLGGDPQILGRASSIGAFVKRGEESGYIKISLRGDTAEEKICIMRKIDVRNKSEWVLNGAVVRKHDVIDVIQKFNIQVNNLTQFLPQDRVCEFAKLTPTQLLEETEKAVGDPDLPVQHRQLVERSGELRLLEVAVKRNEETLNRLKALNAEQERDVERIRQRENLLKMIESMKKKLPWLKYDLKKKEYTEAQNQEIVAREKMEGEAKILNDIKGPIEERKKVKTTHESSARKISGQITQNVNNRRAAIEEECQLNVQLKAKYAEMEDLKRQEQSRQQRIMKAKEDLAAAERELADLPIYEPPRAQMESFTELIGELNHKINQLRMRRKEKESQSARERESLRKCSDRLKQMENKSNKLLRALQNTLADKIFEAYDWVQEHQSQFRKEVYGPVLVEVNVQDQAHACYLENHVPNYIWKSFITQDASDRDFLVKNLKSYDIPVLNFIADRGTSRMPFNITPEMRQLGIYTRLDQVFDAPPCVKDVLVTQANLDHSYIGTDETHRRADDTSRLGISDFWTPENHYRWSRSRYGGHLSANVDAVNPSRLFMCNMDVGDLEILRSRKDEHERNISDMEEILKLLQKEMRQLEDEMANIHRQREEITEKVRSEKRRRQEMQGLVDLRRRKLAYINKEEDMESSTRKLLNQASQLNEQRFQAVIKLKNLLMEAVALKWSYTEKNMASIELDTKIREMEKDVKQHEKHAILAATNYENCKRLTKELKEKLHDAKKHAESIAIITKDLEHEFLEMPGTIEELESAIQDTLSEANSVLFLNQNVLQEYQNRQRQIESISIKLEEDKGKLERCCLDIETLKGKWLPTLQTLVAKINDTFSRNFQEMAVAGEVSLDEHGVDFNQYGILIKVKFRQTGELQVLSAHHQSGGERSVSTILYLVSLQDLTNCPFRVVDEINQGMDPINERKMFQQLVRASSQPNTPQCFLLTPKVLPDLEYSDACSILNIMNGPWIEKPAKAWSAGECWRTVMSVGRH